MFIRIHKIDIDDFEKYQDEVLEYLWYLGFAELIAPYELGNLAQCVFDTVLACHIEGNSARKTALICFGHCNDSIIRLTSQETKH